MNTPLKWLRDYVDIDADIREFTEKMTMSGTKVEGYEEVGGGIEKVVIGKILEIEKHPDADKLVVTQMDVGDRKVQIVTGASNVSVGDIVPVALDGALLPGGVQIKTGKLRGVTSEGMLCSAKELGVDEKYIAEESKNGIWLLRGEGYALGQDVREALQLRDYIVEFELTSNRPDCQSMIGLAYEAAATLDAKVKLPPSDYRETEEEISWTIRVEDEELCPRYALKEIKNVKIGPSPYEIQRKLIEAGVRPINNIVDITNFVMLEYGQPMHAFDADRLKTKEILVRKAKAGESFVTLDDEKRTLDETMLMITDGGEPVAIAGIMGGQNSEVTEDTVHVLLESANFGSDGIRRSSKKLGLRTEASARFEKGIDLMRVEQALDRACHLIEAFGCGEVLRGRADTLRSPIEKKTVSASIEKINRLIGEELSVDTILRLLERLSFECRVEGDLLTVTLPTFRQDIDMGADIAEEVARLYGYNNIRSAEIYGEMTVGLKTPAREIEDIIKYALMANGLTEIKTYSFVSPKSLEKAGADLEKAVRIINPLGEETSVMRTSLLPAMLGTMGLNLSRKVEFFAGFELGNIFFAAEGEPLQKRDIVAGVYGKDEDFFTMKSRLEGVLAMSGISGHAYIPSAENPFYHPKRCAAVEIKGEIIGYIGEVHPAIAESFEIKKRVYIFQLDFDKIAEKRVHSHLYRPVAKFPAIKRDIALVVSDEIFVRDIETIIMGEGSELIEKVELFDIYRGEQVPEGKKSVAYSIVYRAADRTLKDEEVNLVQEKVLKALQAQLDVKIREI